MECSWTRIREEVPVYAARITQFAAAAADLMSHGSPPKSIQTVEVLLRKEELALNKPMAGAAEDITERSLDCPISEICCKMSFYFFVKHLKDAALDILPHVIQAEGTITSPFIFLFYFSF